DMPASYKVGENKAFALYNFPRCHRDRARKYGGVVDKRVELSVFAARVHGCGKIRKKSLVEIAAREAPVELARIGARHSGADTCADHFSREFMRRQIPQRKQRCEAGVS